MKVGILTLKLHSNFGFLMQTYALQKVVRNMGHEPYHFYIKEEPETLLNKIIVFFKKTIKNTFMGGHYKLLPYHPTKEDMEIKDKHTWDFIYKNIQLTPYIPKLTTKTAFNLPLYDAYIVGSDQVWRREFTDDILCYFFNFLPEKTKRMSYAASFGTSSLSYSKKAILTCAKLIKKFDIVTVREDDGVRICKDYFNCDSTKVLDPTMLLSADDYLSLINDPEIPFCRDHYIFTYILRPDKEKEEFIKKFAEDRKMKVINLMPQKLERVGKKGISECIYPSVSSWIKGFSQADYILTDSFHATVFSIIFKKQFYVINDVFGGSSRIPSLLKTLKLANRYSVDYNGILTDINYLQVEEVLCQEKKRSITIISNFLS